MSRKMFPGVLVVHVLRGRGFPPRATGGIGLAFCSIRYEFQQADSAVRSSAAPTWKANFKFDVTSREPELCITVWFQEATRNDDLVGRAVVLLDDVYTGISPINEIWVNLGGGDFRGARPQVLVSVEFQKSEKKIDASDFDLLAVVGRGGFGKVMQVQKKDSNRVYAMKVIQKSHVVKKNKVPHAKAEKEVLSTLRHPYIVSLKFSFQTEDKLFLVLDFLNGGELFYHLKRVHRFSEEAVRVFSGQMILALEFLHSKGIVYRDIKPENIMLDRDGNAILCDFGLVKTGLDSPTSRTSTFCGTTEYLAPELILRDPYGKAVDWWSLGTLMFELLCGLPPFYVKDVQEMYENILYAPIRFPPYLSSSVVSLLRALLRRNPTRRLGGGPRDAEEIKEHPFFAKIDWAALERKEIKSAFLPKVANDMDLSNVPAERTKDVPQITPSSRALSVGESLFEGFTYTDESELNISDVMETEASQEEDTDRDKQMSLDLDSLSLATVFEQANPSDAVGSRLGRIAPKRWIEAKLRGTSSSPAVDETSVFFQSAMGRFRVQNLLQTCLKIKNEVSDLLGASSLQIRDHFGTELEELRHVMIGILTDHFCNQYFDVFIHRTGRANFAKYFHFISEFRRVPTVEFAFEISGMLVQGTNTECIPPEEIRSEIHRRMAELSKVRANRREELGGRSSSDLISQPGTLARQIGLRSAAALLVESDSMCDADVFDAWRNWCADQLVKCCLLPFLSSQQFSNFASVTERMAEDNLKQEVNAFPLHYAARVGALKQIQKVLDEGGLVDLRNDFGETPLHVAALRGHAKAAQKLLDNGADPVLEAYSGDTALGIAASSGSTKVIKLLLERGAIMSARNLDGNTALHLAAQFNQSGAVRVLLKRGASLDVKNYDGKTPFDVAPPGHRSANLLKFHIFKPLLLDLKEQLKSDAENFIVFTDAWSVGIDRFDHDHQHLFDIINTLYRLIKASAAAKAGTGAVLADSNGDWQIRQVLDGLLAYASFHFKSESDSMRESGFPVDKWRYHVREHELFEQKMQAMVQKYKEAGAGLDEELFEYMKNWLMDHVFSLDKLYTDSILEYEKMP